MKNQWWSKYHSTVLSEKNFKNSPTWLCLEKPFSRGACKKLDMSAAPKYYFSRDKRPFDFSKTLSVMRRQQLSKNGDNYFCGKSFHKIFQKPVTNIFFTNLLKKLLTRCKYCNYVLWSKIPAKFRFSKFVRQLEFDKNSVVNFWVKIYYVTVRECLSKTSGKISWIFSGYVFELPWRHETRKNISWINSELSGSNPESRKLFSEPNDVFVEIFVIRKNQKIKPFVL